MRIPIKRGSTLDLPMQVLRNGAPMSLAGKTLTYVVKAVASAADADAVLTFTAVSGLTITSESTGQFTLSASAEAMNLPRNFYYAALQIRDNTTGAVIELPELELHDVWEMVGHLILSIT
jgi:hypothetical protein